MRLVLMDLAMGLGATGVLPIEALLARRASRPGHRSWTVAEGEWIRKSSTSASASLSSCEVYGGVVLTVALLFFLILLVVIIYLCRAAPGDGAYTPSRSVHFAGVVPTPPAARMPGSGFSYMNTPSSFGSVSYHGTPSSSRAGNTPYNRGIYSSGGSRTEQLGGSGILGGLDAEDDGGGDEMDNRGDGYTNYGLGSAKKRRESDSSRHRSPFSRTSVGMKSADASFADARRESSYYAGIGGDPMSSGHGFDSSVYASGNSLIHPTGIMGGDHMEGGNQGMMTVDEICQSWVVISGFYPDNYRTRRIQEIFNARGTVVVIKESTGNWVLARFTSTKEAIRAQHQNDGVMIADGIVVGVRQMNAQMAQSMGLQLTSDGGFVSANGEDFDGFLAGNEGDVGGSSNGTGGREKQRGAEGREIDPSSDAWAHGADYQLTARDPEYVGVGEARSRTRGGRGGAGDREARTPLRLQGSHVEVTGPVSPSLYLRPLKRDSLCDKVMKFFGFR